MSINALRDGIESVYCPLVSTLQTAANKFVPKCRKGFFKFWCDEELHVLKDAAISSNQAWKDAANLDMAIFFVEDKFAGFNIAGE